MIKNSFLAVAGFALMASSLTGCNTARGLGADVEELGRLMQGKPKTGEVVEVQTVVDQAPATYVQPQSGVETYPYQGGVSYPVVPAQPAQPQAYPSQDPSLGEVVPAKTIKEM